MPNVAWKSAGSVPTQKWTALSLLSSFGGLFVSMGAVFWVPLRFPPWSEHGCHFSHPAFVFLMPAYSPMGYTYVLGLVFALFALHAGEAAAVPGAPNRPVNWRIAFLSSAVPLSILLLYVALGLCFHR